MGPVAHTWKVWRPAGSLPYFFGEEQGAAGALSRLQRNVERGRELTKVKSARRNAPTLPLGPVLIVVRGASASIATIASAVAMLPAA